jgi:tetratricopeptide (TPR) repeat protein
MEPKSMSEGTLDLVALFARALQAGHSELSDDLRGKLLHVAPNSATALSLAASLDLSKGNMSEAVRNIDAALAIDPNNLNANAEATRIFLRAGQPRRAILHSQRVLDELPDFPGLRDLYFKCAFSGTNYKNFLPLIHECLAPSVYLETGVQKGHSFESAQKAEIAIGVDPNLMKVPAGFHDWGHLFETTSDDFFTSGLYEKTCGERRIDTAFIDGMHLFEYTLRDFVNIERRCHADSVVLIHDVIPMNSSSGARLRETTTWMGDVWKAIVALSRYRADLEITVLDLGPSGLAVVRGLDPSSTVLSDKYSEIVAALMDEPLVHGFLDSLNVHRVAPDADAIRAFLTR